MTEIDDVILEYMSDISAPYDYRIVQPPKTVWRNLVIKLEVIDRSPATVRRRMQKLEQMELLESDDSDGTYYAITEKGAQYIRGELGIKDLSKPDSE